MGAHWPRVYPREGEQWKNRVQLQEGRSLPVLFAYGSGAVRQGAVEVAPPLGFVWPACQHTEGYHTIHTPGLLQCEHCRHRPRCPPATGSPPASKLPLTNWSLGLYLLPRQENAIFAMEPCANSASSTN